MKTAKEILKKQGVEMTDFISSSAHDGVIEAMKAYALAKIEEAMEGPIYTQLEMDDFAKGFCYWMETVDSGFRLGKSWDELLNSYKESKAK